MYFLTITDVLIGVNIFRKLHVSQLRLWVFFGAIRHLHRGILDHTKEVAYKTLVRPQLEYAAAIWHPYNDTQTAKVEKVRNYCAEDSSQVDLQEIEEHQ